MNEIATITAQPISAAEQFSLQQRQARMFALSPLVPEHLRKGDQETAIANCYIALKLAEVMGEAPLVVMQNIHVVKGKAGFAAQYMIARANNSGIFRGRIDWRIDRSDPKNLSITAWATLRETGDEVSFTCDMAMAQAEGWTSNPKYKSMPELMLRYRSATFLVRLYAPDVMLGYQTVEEVSDMGAVEVRAAPIRLSSAMLAEQAGATIEHDDDGVITDAETVDHEPEGPADEQMGEAHSDSEPALWEVKWHEIDNAITAAKTERELKAATDELMKHVVTFPADMASKLEASAVKARDAIRAAAAA